MGPLEVIVVTPDAPDPFGNAAGRWYYVLAKGLSERGSQVRWLAAYTQEASAARARACLTHPNLKLKLYPYPQRRWLQRKWKTLERPYSYFISDSLVRDLEAQLSRGYDVLHLEETWSGWLGLEVPRTLLSILWLARIDLARSGRSSFRERAHAALMKWTERRIIGGFDAIRALTPRDGQVIARLNPRAHVFTIPLAIDPDLYAFGRTDPQQPTIGLIGSMRWGPTRSAAIRLLTSIWPRVRSRMPGAQLLIAGRGARESLAAFSGGPGVSLLEDMPTAEPSFRRLSVLAYPVSYGSGMKVKVLEAMAYGVPVVTTGAGIEGIEAADGIHAAIVDEDDAFVDRIVTLVADEAARKRMRLAARRLVEEEYSPGPVLSKIGRAYEDLA